MTEEVFRSYLNTVFVSLKTKEYGKESKLSAQDEGLLLGVCNIVKYGESNVKSDYDIAYQNNIEPVIIHWRDTMSQNEASPYLLRQVKVAIA